MKRPLIFLALVGIFLPLFLFALTANAQVPTAGLISHWAFDGNANDSVGTTHGTLVGGPTFTVGKIGRHLIFKREYDNIIL